MSDTLIAKLAVVCETEADAPVHFFSVDELFSEFQELGTGQSKGPTIDDAFNQFMGYAQKKGTMNDVSSTTRANVLRVIACDGMFPEQFYAELSNRPSAELKTHETVVSALSAYTERGSGSDDAWICNNYSYLRQVLRSAKEEFGKTRAHATITTPSVRPTPMLEATIPDDIDARFNSLFN